MDLQLSHVSGLVARRLRRSYYPGGSLVPPRYKTHYERE